MRTNVATDECRRKAGEVEREIDGESNTNKE